MGQSPFARKGLFPQARHNRRRSTRIDYEVPIILSGRDASGQAFREETTTLIVNFHGAKVRTIRQVLVGMMITVENARSGQSGKAVCVQVYEAEPGALTHAIALQLVHPENIWGVENAPDDWELVAAELGGRYVSRPEPAVRPAVPVKGPPVPPSSDQPPVGEVLREVVNAHVAGLEKRAADVTNTAAQNLRGRLDEAVSEVQREFHQRLEVMVKAAEQRSLEAMELASAQFGSALETLKGEALAEISRDALQDFETKVGGMVAGAVTQMSGRTEELTEEFQVALDTLRAEAMGEVAREAVASFEQRMADLAAENEKRVAQRIDQAFAELEAALETFRNDLGDELEARKEQMLQSTEQTLRARVAAMLSSVLSPTGDGTLTQQLHPAEKK